jgi:hypothetical protein
VAFDEAVFMSAEISLPILFVALFAAQSTQAQPVTCPKTLRWIDATHLQRSTRIAGHIGKADTEIFSNATISHLEFDNVSGAVIMMKGKDYPNGINLTFGTGYPKPPKPFDFAEISMAVEPPISEGIWPRISGPCVVDDGVSVHFDETDSSHLFNNVQKFHGTLKRNGLSINYSLVFEDGSDSDSRVEMQGVWKYERELKSFSLETDVQGWHVYRANTYLMTLPIGTQISLATVLKQVTTPSTAN